MDENNKTPENLTRGTEQKYDVGVPEPYGNSSPQPETGTRTDYEAMGADELNEEVSYEPTQTFGNGTRTEEDDVADSGIGSDVDTMVEYMSGQADYESEQGETSDYDMPD